jgi:PTH1 family peptidyl-tRNA hydrolase
MSRVDFVLGRFEPEEMSAVRAAIERAGEALACMVRDGIEVAMNRYNERRLPSAEG